MYDSLAPAIPLESEPAPQVSARLQATSGAGAGRVGDDHHATQASGAVPLPDRVVVINDLSIAKGGGTGLALLSIRLFRAMGLPVTFLCGDEGHNPEFASLDIDVVPIGGKHILQASRGRALVTGLHNAAARTTVDNWIIAHDTPGTIYHVHGWSKIMSPAIFSALLPVAGRTVLHSHDYFLACPNGAFYSYPTEEVCMRRPLGTSCLTHNCDKRNYAQKLWRAGRMAYLFHILQDISRAPGKILLLHEKMRDQYERAGYSRSLLHVVRNPVVPYCDERVRVEENEEFFFVGRLEPEKGIEDAVKAAIAANVRLTIIGDGPLRASLSGLGPAITVLGWQSHAEIAEKIRQARALLMPTRYPEPFGLVAAEASRSGIPVILSDKACLAEEMAAGGIGISCDTGDSGAFAAALREMAEISADEIRQMSVKAFGRSVVLATSPQEWRDALLAHYGGLLSGEVAHER